MAANQDYTEDMAQGDFSNESYGDFNQQTTDFKQEDSNGGGTEQNGNEAMEEASNGDSHQHDSASSSDQMGGKDEDR